MLISIILCKYANIHITQTHLRSVIGCESTKTNAITICWLVKIDEIGGHVCWSPYRWRHIRLQVERRESRISNYIYLWSRVALCGWLQSGAWSTEREARTWSVGTRDARDGIHGEDEAGNGTQTAWWVSGTPRRTVHSQWKFVNVHFVHIYPCRADGSRGGCFLPAFVCVSVFPHSISKTNPARITKLDVEMFHDESWKPVYFWP